ncbi:MAG: hypothetical protein GX413_13060 [Acetobacter sp.]|nr:hypothetical protein [Acetobacter sp.]
MNLPASARWLKSCLRSISLVPVTGLFLLTACQSQQGSVSQLSDRHNTLIYNYLIVHGMSQGSVMAGNTPREQIPLLIQLDKTALLSVILATSQPTHAHRDLAVRSMQDLIAFLTPADLTAGVKSSTELR